MEPQKFVLSFSLFILVILLPVTIPGDVSRQLIVWNVGQGQWVTLIDRSECWHFDTGGEIAPWDGLIELCATRLNRIFLSHWDKDHISFANGLARRTPSCLLS